MDEDTLKKFTDAMKKCIECNDREVDHQEADDILCKLLEKLGYAELVGLYDKVGKWYA